MDKDIFSQLSRSHLFYMACRVAFLKVFDKLLDEFFSNMASERQCGFMERIPMLAGTAPQVQVELLLQTWQSLRSEKPRLLTIEEQVICFGITSELAHTGEARDQQMIRRAARGPRQVDPGEILWLASRTRLLQMILPFAPQAAILQVESSVPTDDLVPIRASGGIDQQSLTGLLSLLGNWTVSNTLFSNAKGLLTDTELDLLRAFFAEHPQLISARTS